MLQLLRAAAIVLLLLSAVPARAEQKPFDALHAAYASYMDPGDPLGFPMKVHALAGNSYKFWRGSKDLFFDWCRTHTQDWNDDPDNWIQSHGDIHFGNIGSYAIAPFGQLGIGLVDFDESCRSPVQVEIMQGIITLRLTARSNQVLVTESQQIELTQILIDAYKQGLTSRENAAKLLAGEKRVDTLLKDAGKSYSKGELKKLAPDGKFISAVFWKDGELKGQLKDIYRPAMSRADEFAEGIEKAIGNVPAMAGMFRLQNRTAIRASIKDAVQRTRVGSSGSQGLKKYLILLEKPLTGIDHDLVLYLKQEIPSAAERSALIKKDPRTPGHRVAEDQAAMVNPPPYLNSWCEIGNESYWVTFKEPWSNEFDPLDFPEYEDLKLAAKFWGVITGASHRKEPHAGSLVDRLTPAQVQLIRERSNDYLRQLELGYIDFTRDPRTAEARKNVLGELARLAR